MQNQNLKVIFDKLSALGSNTLTDLEKILNSDASRAAIATADAARRESDYAERLAAILRVKTVEADLRATESDMAVAEQQHAALSAKLAAQREKLQSAVARHSAAKTELNRAHKALAPLGEADIETALRRVACKIEALDCATDGAVKNVGARYYLDCVSFHEVEAKRKLHKTRLNNLRGELARVRKIQEDLDSLRLAEVAPDFLKTQVRNLLDEAGLPDAEKEAASRTYRLLNSPENINSVTC